MPERLNLKISCIGANVKPKASMTLAKLIELIKGKGYPPSTEEKLIKMAKNQPRDTYENFAKNIYSYLKKCKNDGK